MMPHNKQQISSTDGLRDELVTLVLERIALEEEIGKDEEHLELETDTKLENKLDDSND